MLFRSPASGKVRLRFLAFPLQTKPASLGFRLVNEGFPRRPVAAFRGNAELRRNDKDDYLIQHEGDACFFIRFIVSPSMFSYIVSSVIVNNVSYSLITAFIICSYH